MRTYMTREGEQAVHLNYMYVGTYIFPSSKFTDIQ